ncbi:MAG TPA: ABC transporter permease [Thermoplasmata archaeon]|nr:ABC transporter permease [Thermoplasmata archaeon]
MRTETVLPSWPTPPATAPWRAFRGLFAFLWTEVLVQAHEELATATAMVTQSVLLVFVWILDPGLLGVALVGAVIFSTFAMGQRVLNEAAYIRIDHKANDLYLASPLSPEAYFLGMAGGILLVYATPVAVMGVLAVTIAHLTLAEGLLLVALAGAVWVCAASIGYVFSTFFRDNRAIWAYSSLFFNVFGVLPPVFYPLGLFPAALRPVALLMPPSAAAALMQGAIGAASLTPGDILLAGGGLGVEAVALFAFAIYWARRTVRGV